MIADNFLNAISVTDPASVLRTEAISNFAPVIVDWVESIPFSLLAFTDGSSILTHKDGGADKFDCPDDISKFLWEISHISPKGADDVTALLSAMKARIQERLS